MKFEILCSFPEQR